MTKSKHKSTITVEDNCKYRPDKKQTKEMLKTLDNAAKRLGLDAIHVKVTSRLY